MTKINSNIIRILVVAVIAIAIIGKLGYDHYREHEQVRELRETVCYEVYFSYVAVREEYNAFILLNDERVAPLNAASVLTDERIAALSQKRSASGQGDHPIAVYLMMPTEELPFGWQKSEANIAANFDTSAFHRATVCYVTIPQHAASLADCEIEYRESGA